LILYELSYKTYTIHSQVCKYIFVHVTYKNIILYIIKLSLHVQEHSFFFSFFFMNEKWVEGGDLSSQTHYIIFEL